MKSRTAQTAKPSAEQATSQSERATLALREMLAQGHFRPGERMREVPLAKQLGISRIPLRLALERLALPLGGIAPAAAAGAGGHPTRHLRARFRPQLREHAVGTALRLARAAARRLGGGRQIGRAHV